MENFMLSLMQAVAKDQSTSALMQESDAVTVENDTQLELTLYNHENAILEAAAAWVNTEEEVAANDPNSKDAAANAANAQAAVTAYQLVSTQAQGVESQADGNVQSAQNQAQTDGSNLAMKAQLAQTLNSIQTTTSNLLMGS